MGRVGMPYNFARVRALIVDDSVFARRLLRSVLTGFGLRDIRDAEGIRDAMEAVIHLPPDIIFLDMMLHEGCDGLDMVKQIRNHEEDAVKFVPIVMISAETKIESIIQARDSGITEFLAKPISAQAVYSRLQWTIEKPRQFIRASEYFGPDRRRKIEDMAGDERRRVEPDFIPIVRRKKAKQTQAEDPPPEAQGQSGEAVAQSA